jgi:hypothetical protein
MVDSARALRRDHNSRERSFLKNLIADSGIPIDIWKTVGLLRVLPIPFGFSLFPAFGNG